MSIEKMKAIVTAGMFSRTSILFPEGETMNRRRHVKDAAFQFRMNTGFAGDINRGHPQSNIEPAINDPTNPVLAYGLACLVNTSANTVRTIETGDSAITAIYGIIGRPYPVQQQATTNFGNVGFGGTQAPPVGGVVDVLKAGYIITPLNGSTAATKGAPVYLYYGASTTGHVQGGFEAGSGSNLIALDATADKIYWNGPAGADGLAELRFGA